MLFDARPPQVPICDFIFNHLRGNVFASMGTGKSSATISAFDGLRMFGEVNNGLIIAPKRVALNTWPEEIVKFNESFGHLKIAAAVGTPAQRIAAVKSKPDLLAINYDNVEWLMEGWGDRWPYDFVASDESTRLKGLRIEMRTSTKGKQYIQGQGSVRAKALARVAHKRVRRWINLTGSPAPNGIQDLWGQQWFIDGGERLGSNFGSFQERWFHSVPLGDYSMIVPNSTAQKEIEDLIRDCTITVDFKDYYDVGEPFETPIYVTLPPAARRVYDEMEKNLFAELRAGIEIDAHNSGGKVQKCLQIANGTVYDGERQWHPVHDQKLQALESVVTEANGESVLVRYTHIPDRERILKTFKQARRFDDNPQTLADWNAGKIRMLLVHAASAGHGLNMQDGGRILADYCTDYNLEHDEQVIERIGPTRQFQSGHPRAVYRYRIIARDTIEEHSSWPRIISKASVQDSLKEAMKRRG